MIFYCNTSRTTSLLAQNLAKNFSFCYLSINNKLNNISDKSELIILLVPIFGEEELNEDWLEFLKNKKDIFFSKKVLVFLFGVYDDFIDNNSVIVRQIKYFLSIHCDDLVFYPKKSSRYNLNFDSIKEYISNYNASELSTIHCQKKIFELEYKNKCLVCKNDDSSLDLTSSYDGFTNMLDILELNERLITLKILVTLSKCSSFTCNKLNLEGFNFNEAFSEYIRRIYFKSCRIKETPNLQKFNNLEVINLSANSIETLDFSRLPKSVKRTNFSKNRIFRLLVNKSGYHNLESMAMFNNKISELSWLAFFPNLKYLNIGMNPINSFPFEVFELHNLEYINIALTSIEYIPQEILKMKKLKVLDIKHCSYIEIKDPILQELRNKGVEVVC